ncbi:NEF1-like protein [Powellomyces hirtus]|nr:NEF1-like protein [Powellomyces hirtus]
MSQPQSLDWNSPTLVSYTPPVSPASFPAIATVLLLAAFSLGSLFFINQVSATKYSQSVIKDLTLAVPASLLFGFGLVTLFLAVGIYV